MFVCLTAVSLISTCPCVTQRRSQSWLLELLVIPICYNDRQIFNTETYSYTNNAMMWSSPYFTHSREVRSHLRLHNSRAVAGKASMPGLKNKEFVLVIMEVCVFICSNIISQGHLAALFALVELIWRQAHTNVLLSIAGILKNLLFMSQTFRKNRIRIFLSQKWPRKRLWLQCSTIYEQIYYSLW